MEKLITWTEFCNWLNGKRVEFEYTNKHINESVTVLQFTDGSSAILKSNWREGSPGYSEYTPGSDQALVPPTVYIVEK